MQPEVLAFLEKERVGALTTLLSDGSPHAAALHFSSQIEPLELYFSTERGSVKCRALLSGEVSKASMVIGLSEEAWVTLQLDGIVTTITDAAELSRVQALHYAKHPNSAKYKDDPETIFLKMTPTWWRYTDYNQKPMLVHSSGER